MCVKRVRIALHKLFFFILALGLLFSTILVIHGTNYTTVKMTYRRYDTLPESEAQGSRLKYILVWTTVNKTEDFGGVFPFIYNRCSNTNCYLTTNNSLLDDYRNFDVIIFNPNYMSDWKKKNLPRRRSTSQKYVFYSALPPDDAPVCNVITEEYFNWTCTYRLDSDIFIPSIEVLDFDGNYITPKTTVNWLSTSISLVDIKLPVNKTKAIAWVVDRCDTHNERITFAKKMQKALKEISLDFDIYGCGFQECPEGGCMKTLRKYYFYYAAEVSDAADYVTTEVLKAYHTLSVPVVKGGADYKKFLPEGSYIDASSVSIDQLVSQIEYAIRIPATYTHFHLWRKFYRVRAVNPFYGLCKICEHVNDDNKFGKYSVKSNFRKWWHISPLYKRCLPKSAESLSYVLSYANKSVW